MKGRPERRPFFFAFHAAQDAKYDLGGIPMSE
jgi:hypothetical protein